MSLSLPYYTPISRVSDQITTYKRLCRRHGEAIARYEPNGIFELRKVGRDDAVGRQDETTVQLSNEYPFI
jgi:hypothetical protein